MRWGRLTVVNYRGVGIPRALGLLIGAAAVLWCLAYALARSVPSSAWASLIGCLLVLVAGLVDDVVAVGPRGLRNHLRALASGHVTTGIVKVIVIVGSAVVVIASTRPGHWWVGAAGVVLVAASANVWNGLDLRPGRALKAYLPMALPFLLAGDLAAAPALVGVSLGALVGLPLDLRERAMLGDGGANLLGFSVGVGLVLVLPGWGVAAAAVAAVALNVLADTVSFSRVIGALGPLRWADRLGRLPAPD